MSGSYLQLVSRGAQDAHLTENPAVSFFQSATKTYTPFACEAIEQNASGTVGYGKKVTYTISRSGDLVSRIYAETQLPALADTDFTGSNSNSHGYVAYPGAKLHKTLTLKIGNQQVDKLYDEWLVIWGEISTPEGRIHAWREQMGAVGTGDVDQAHANLFVADGSGGTTARYVEVDFPFWFCRDASRAFPLIALLFHDMKLEVEFCAYADILGSSDSDVTGVGTAVDFSSTYKLWVDYIFLSESEREFVASRKHEFLIEQLQQESFSFGDVTTATVEPKFNHPVSELLFVLQETNTFAYGGSNATYGAAGTAAGTLNWLEYDDAGTELVTDLTIKVNGNTRQALRPAIYYSHTQMCQHHTRVPSDITLRVYCYSFALAPESKQPSGSLNFSRIDTFKMTFTIIAASAAFAVRVYARNHNVMTIENGLAGLLYAS